MAMYVSQSFSHACGARNLLLHLVGIPGPHTRWHVVCMMLMLATRLLRSRLWSIRVPTSAGACVSGPPFGCASSALRCQFAP